ncbi:MAG: hypothetical protein FWE01_00255 [Firmicutes bacterium]|nr:hypothetical protein [Bacillota bacterium]
MQEQEEINYEIIDLTPDMSSIWGKVLSQLREHDSILYAAVSEQVDIDFTREDIRLYTSNQTLYNIMERGLKLLNEIAGTPTEINDSTIKIFFNKKQTLKTNKIDKLRKIFGEDLIIKP